VDWGQYAGLAGLALLTFLVLRYLSLKPSNERDWVIENRRMACAEFEGDEVTMRNVRDFTWRSTKDFDVNQTPKLETT